MCVGITVWSKVEAGKPVESFLLLLWGNKLKVVEKVRIVWTSEVYVLEVNQIGFADWFMGRVKDEHYKWHIWIIHPVMDSMVNTLFFIN